MTGPNTPRDRRTRAARLAQLERDAADRLAAELSAMSDADLEAIVRDTPPALAARFARMSDAELAALAGQSV